MNSMPAEPNSGIVFRRSDVRDNNIIYPSFLMFLAHHIAQELKMRLVAVFQQ